MRAECGGDGGARAHGLVTARPCNVPRETRRGRGCPVVLSWASTEQAAAAVKRASQRLLSLLRAHGCTSQPCDGGRAEVYIATACVVTMCAVVERISINCTTCTGAATSQTQSPRQPPLCCGSGLTRLDGLTRVSASLSAQILFLSLYMY